MFANILQLSAGILLAISSFIGKNSIFQVPVSGQKLPGSLETFKQTWLVRSGLILLVCGYVFPMTNWDIKIPDDFPEPLWLFIGLVITCILVLIAYHISVILAERDFKKAPVFSPDNTKIPVGAMYYEPGE